jgi:hypothetical protein
MPTIVARHSGGSVRKWLRIKGFGAKVGQATVPRARFGAHVVSFASNQA